MYQCGILWWTMAWGSFHTLFLSIPGGFLGQVAVLSVAAWVNMLVLWNLPFGYFKSCVTS